MPTRQVLLAVLIASLAASPALAQPAPQPAPPQSEPAAPGLDADIRAGNEAFQAEDWQAAATAYQAALAKGSTARLVHFRLGYALHMLKRYEEALTHHLIATQIANRALRTDALYNAACAHALLGHKDDALKFLTHAIDAGFVDLDQVGKDSDLDSLRSDDAFKSLVAGIGKTPRLHEQLDFFLGSWKSVGGVTHETTVSRPLAASQAIVTTTATTPSSNGGSRTGLLVPVHADRTWQWTSSDSLGTVVQLTGRAIQPAGARFEGRESSAAGPGLHLRITLTPQGADTVVERVEVSEDGARWQMQRETTYSRTAGADAEMP